MSSMDDIKKYRALIGLMRPNLIGIVDDQPFPKDRGLRWS